MRRLFATLLFLIIIAIVILYFLPGTIHFEKTMVLKARPELVFKHLDETAEWKNWAAWLKEDPMNEITYHGPERGAGAALNWNSQVPEISTGNVLIESSQASTQVRAAIQFGKYGKSNNNYILENTGNGTNATWAIDLSVAEKGFPAGWINKIKAMSWKSKIDAWMDASLKNLDEATANDAYYPEQTAHDTLSNKLDSLAAKVDSLKKSNKEKDTVYISP